MIQKEDQQENTMAKKEKLEQFNARIPASLSREFRKTIPKGMNKQHAVQAAVRLWCGVPKDLQSKLLLEEMEPDSSSNPGFRGIVEQVVKDVLKAQKIVRSATKKAKTSQKK